MSTVPPPLQYAPPPRTNLRLVASRQRAVMLCILAYIGAVVLQFALPPQLRIVVLLLAAAASITGAVFVFMLAMTVYNTAAGVVLGILTLVPLVGLIVLLIVNGKATNMLRAAGVHVGLLGANPNDVPAE